MPTKKSKTTSRQAGARRNGPAKQLKRSRLTIEPGAPDPGDEIPINGKAPEKKEAVNHPDHYGGADNPYEVIKVIEAFPRILNCGLKFNATKYLLRAGEKVEDGMTPEEAEIQDLQKMIWYGNRRITNLKKILLERE
jgi:hypothetical protein